MFKNEEMESRTECVMCGELFTYDDELDHCGCYNEYLDIQESYPRVANFIRKDIKSGNQVIGYLKERGYDIPYFESQLILREEEKIRKDGEIYKDILVEEMFNDEHFDPLKLLRSNNITKEKVALELYLEEIEESYRIA